MISSQALAELALCLSLALAVVCAGEPIRLASYLNPWASSEKSLALEPNYKDAQVPLSPFESASFGSSINTNEHEGGDINLFIQTSADYSNKPLDTPSLDSLEQARMAFSSDRPIFFRSYIGTPATVASYRLKDARKLPLYEVELQAGIGQRRRRMTASTKRRRVAMLARIARKESELEALENDDVPLEKRGGGLELTRYNSSKPKQVWKPIKMLEDVKKPSRVNDDKSWTPWSNSVPWLPRISDLQSINEGKWDPNKDPVHVITDDSNLQWQGSRAPGHHIPRSKSTGTSQTKVDRKYNGELEEAFKKVKPLRSWADTITGSVVVDKEVPVLKVLDKGFPSLAHLQRNNQAPIARPLKGKEIVSTLSRLIPAKVEGLSKDNYRFSP